MLAPIGALIQSEYRIKYLGPKLVFLPVAPGYSKQKFKIMGHTELGFRYGCSMVANLTLCIHFLKTVCGG